jgi:ELWxxDGT repeat protein
MIMQITASVVFAQLPFLIKDIASEGVSQGHTWEWPANAAKVNDRLLFWHNDGVHGKELWATDGTESGTYMVMDIVPGSGEPYVHGAFKQNEQGVFFTIGNPNAQAIWFTDGTAQNTKMLIKEDAQYQLSWEPTFRNNSAVVGNHIYVRGAYSQGGFVYPRVYKVSTEVENTSPAAAVIMQMGYLNDRIEEVCAYKDDVVVTCYHYNLNGNHFSLRNINGSIIASSDYPFSNLKNVNDYYFAFLNSLPGETYLSKIDNLTDFDIQRLTTVQSFIYLERENEPGGAKALGNKLFFYKDLSSQNDLWCTDGTTAGTRKAPFTGQTWFNGVDGEQAIFTVHNFNGANTSKAVKWDGGPTVGIFTENPAFFHNDAKLIKHSGKDFLFAGTNAFVRIGDDQHTYKIFGFESQVGKLQVGWEGNGRYVHTVNNQIVFLGTHNGYNVGVEPFKLPMGIKIWTGDVSTDWHNEANWQPNGVPTCTQNILIPETPTANYPVVNADASCSSIYINYGSVTVSAGFKLNYYGQLSNYGTVTGTFEASLKTTYYPDADGDGHGDVSKFIEACSAPAGYAILGDDCNDNDNTVYPGSAEICDGKDNNCDGQIDEGVKTTFYRDADGDSYGNSALTVQDCSAPPGYVTNSIDCNDGNANINPGKTEICGNSIDDNCNGQTDEGCNISNPTIRINDVSVYETQGIATLALSLSHASAQDIKVSYQTIDRTAASKGRTKDYIAAKGSIIIRAGEVSKVINIAILTDNLQEADEFFDVTISLGRNEPATISKSTGTITIKEGSSLITKTIVSSDEIAEMPIGNFKVITYPNPGKNQFTLQITSYKEDPVSVKVFDVLGRVVESIPGLSANTRMKFGQAYRPGTYIVKVQQGQEVRQLKLIKLSD